MELELKTFSRIGFDVRAVQVTGKNMHEIAKWTGGDVQQKNGGSRFIKIEHVHRPSTQKHTEAFVTDWILESPNGFKIYTNRAFHNSFEEKFVKPTETQQLLEDVQQPGVVFDKVDMSHESVGVCDGCDKEKQVKATPDGRAQLCDTCTLLAEEHGITSLTEGPSNHTNISKAREI